MTVDPYEAYPLPPSPIRGIKVHDGLLTEFCFNVTTARIAIKVPGFVSRISIDGILALSACDFLANNIVSHVDLYDIEETTITNVLWSLSQLAKQYYEINAQTKLAKSLIGHKALMISPAYGVDMVICARSVTAELIPQ
jgi:hypothetical protein